MNENNVAFECMNEIHCCCVISYASKKKFIGMDTPFVEDIPVNVWSILCLQYNTDNM